MAPYNLTGGDELPGADPDFDTLNNLMEYALGGDPANANDVGILPTSTIRLVDGTKFFEYVYRRRVGAATRRLTYEVQNDDDLVNSPAWTNEFQEVSTTAIDSDFESVLNRISMAGQVQEFGRLNVELP